MGFITRGFGVSVHRRDCKNYIRSVSDPEEKDRWINVKWANTDSEKYTTAIHITAKERSLSLINIWFPPEAVKLAYDRTIERIEEMNFRYMDKIIINWHEKGLHTPEEIEEGDTGRASRTRRVKKTEAENKAKAPSAEETNRLLKLIERMGE